MKTVKNYLNGLVRTLQKTQEKFSSNLFSETDLNVFCRKVLPEYPENAKRY
jgi:hypothetical protein